MFDLITVIYFVICFLCACIMIIFAFRLTWNGGPGDDPTRYRYKFYIILCCCGIIIASLLKYGIKFLLIE